MFTLSRASLLDNINRNFRRKLTVAKRHFRRINATSDREKWILLCEKKTRLPSVLYFCSFRRRGAAKTNRQPDVSFYKWTSVLAPRARSPQPNTENPKKIYMRVHGPSDDYLPLKHRHSGVKVNRNRGINNAATGPLRF